jgi:hypothetical protein
MHNLMSLCYVMSQGSAFSRIRTIEKIVTGSRNEPWRFYSSGPDRDSGPSTVLRPRGPYRPVTREPADAEPDIRFTDCWAEAVRRVGEAAVLRRAEQAAAEPRCSVAAAGAESAKMHPDMLRRPAPGSPWRTCIVRK